LVPDDDPDAPYRESIRYEGWPVELFVHTRDSVVAFRTAIDDERRSGALSAMITSGTTLAGDDVASEIRQAEHEYLEAGPPPLDEEALSHLRYALTDILDDFMADPHGPEAPFVLASLLPELVELELERRGAWRGSGKWILRRAAQADPAWAAELSAAIDAWKAGDAEPLVSIVRATLDASGGPLFEGYRASGKPLLEK
jgi:hypothetical protein